MSYLRQDVLPHTSCSAEDCGIPYHAVIHRSSHRLSVERDTIYYYDYSLDI